MTPKKPFYRVVFNAVKCAKCKYFDVCYRNIPFPLRMICPGPDAVKLADETLPGRKINISTAGEAKVPKSAIPSPDKGLDHLQVGAS